MPESDITPSPAATSQLYQCNECGANYEATKVPNFCPACGNQLYSDDKLSRATFQRRMVSNGNGKKVPEYSINLQRGRFWLSFASLMLALGASIYGGSQAASIAVTRSIERKFDTRIANALEPPSGVVYRAIETGINIHETRSDRDLSAILSRITRRLDRQELIMCQIYTEMFGRRPPDIDRSPNGQVN